MRYLSIFCVLTASSLFLGCDVSLNTDCDPALVASLEADLDDTLRAIEDKESYSGKDLDDKELDDLYDLKDDLEWEKDKAISDCNSEKGKDWSKKEGWDKKEACDEGVSVEKDGVVYHCTEGMWLKDCGDADPVEKDGVTYECIDGIWSKV